MRRIGICCLIVLLLFCGCAAPSRGAEESAVNVGASGGVWLSFSEINTMLKSKDGVKAEFEKVVQNCASLQIEHLYIHVRAFCDSLFESEYFPLIEAMNGIDFDVFAYMIERCHASGMKVHAWINPYRVSTSTEDITVLRQDSPAVRWRTDDDPDNDQNVITYGGGVYLNPAEYEVQELVMNGIREILEKYPVDGIHFDDYFYPTTDEAFDSKSYQAYQKSGENPLPLAEWRRSNVNALISGSYTAVKFYNKELLFTVSPMASIEKNYDNLYADVAGWVESGCVDAIIPQLYFGYEYPDKAYCFDRLLKEWETLAAKNRNVALMIGLAPYKIGTESEPDRAEWGVSDDILARQVETCYTDGAVTGYSFFSYTSLFSQEALNTRQRENVKKAIRANT